MDESERILPKMEKTDFDFVLIDGRHAFPTPFIDWYYTAPKIKIGGLVLIDDTHLWTGQELRNFLVFEPEWELKASFQKSVVFMKVNEGSNEKEWNQKRFLLRKSIWGIRKEQARFAISLFSKGEYSQFVKLFTRRFRKHQTSKN